MPLLILNLSCENVTYPVRKHFKKTNINNKPMAFLITLIIEQNLVTLSCAKPGLHSH